MYYYYPIGVLFRAPIQGSITMDSKFQLSITEIGYTHREREREREREIPRQRRDLLLGKHLLLEVGKEVAMSKENSNQKSTLPKLVKLDNAFKLAELWVSKMSKSTEEESTERELVGRPPRLGLGATVPRQSTPGFSNDPIGMKLLSKLEAGKRKAARDVEDFAPSAKDGADDTDDDDEDLDSRTNAFSKKRSVPLISPLQAKKNKKKK